MFFSNNLLLGCMLVGFTFTAIILGHAALMAHFCYEGYTTTWTRQRKWVAALAALLSTYIAISFMAQFPEASPGAILGLGLGFLETQIDLLASYEELHGESVEESDEQVTNAG